MNLKIAFCGPNQELNDKLMRHVKDVIGNEVVDTIVLPNPVAEMLEMTRTEPQHWIGPEIDWFNLFINNTRRMREVAVQDEPLVLSASCGIDQVVVQATWLQDQVESNTSGLVIADATGQNIATPQMAMINRAGSVLQVLLNQTEEEVAEYWDFVYAVIPVTLGVSNAPDALLVQYEDFLTSVPVFTSVIRLPDNEDAVMDFLESEVGKWKEHLSASS